MPKKESKIKDAVDGPQNSLTPLQEQNQQLQEQNQQLQNVNQQLHIETQGAKTKGFDLYSQLEASQANHQQVLKAIIEIGKHVGVFVEGDQINSGKVIQAVIELSRNSGQAVSEEI